MAASREEVWLTLSELWLDTQLDEPGLQRIARQLRAGGLGHAELQDIMLYEVAPVVWLNHWSVAGVWDGFDESWLFAGCRRNQQRGRWHRCKCRLLRRPMTYACMAEWQRVLTLLEQ
ncbi:MAG: DUF7079 family protein [Pseudomonas sp.]